MKQDSLKTDRQLRAEAKAKARDYFLNKKEHKTYYSFACSIYEDYNDPFWLYFEYTPEEMARIKELIIEEYNSQFFFNRHVSTLASVWRNYVFLDDLTLRNSELDKMLGPCRTKHVKLLWVHDKPCRHLYSFSYINWDSYDQKPSDRQQFLVKLTDKEYITLLTEQLNSPWGFSFNQLLMNHPELATKILKSANACPTCMIILDEVLADADIINGTKNGYIINGK